MNIISVTSSVVILILIILSPQLLLTQYTTIRDNNQHAINTITMMTFKEYLIETSNLMSRDAMKQAGAKFDKLRLGKSDGSRPSRKRADQIEKRSNRKRGRAEEEEEKNVDAQIKKFFTDNPAPSDDVVHALASKLGMEHSELEERIYRLLHKHI